jgi:nucleotide-binding universal stress UspA family protein
VTEWLICGIDGSRGAREAARCAKETADRLAAGLELVHVTQVPIVAGAGGVPHAREWLRESAVSDARDLLTRVAAEAGCLDAERRVEIGEPVRRLIAVAQERDALMLVVGSRGRSALRAVLFGSVSLGLCRRSPRPVLLIPPDAIERGYDAPTPEASVPPPAVPLTRARMAVTSTSDVPSCGEMRSRPHGSPDAAPRY